ncbi:hypothetical protein EVAR_44681_1 [Eumeta japonica]|uniref:Uncharacterized protein n=1 Tax=Eumeta variegata TaxID=151549 RepID=A0A4C1Y527_EUMVA|nr:hypothetical protein EVAR_44681_1 [Eumeta japonica]
MVCAWRERKDIIHYELSPPCKIMNSDLYCHQLKSPKQEIDQQKAVKEQTVETQEFATATSWAVRKLCPKYGLDVSGYRPVAFHQQKRNALKQFYDGLPLAQFYSLLQSSEFYKRDAPRAPQSYCAPAQNAKPDGGIKLHLSRDHLLSTDEVISADDVDIPGGGSACGARARRPGIITPRVYRFNRVDKLNFMHPIMGSRTASHYSHSFNRFPTIPPRLRHGGGRDEHAPNGDACEG